MSIDGPRATDSEMLTEKLQVYNAGDEVTLGLRRVELFSRVIAKLASVRSIQQSGARR